MLEYMGDSEAEMGGKILNSSESSTSSGSSFGRYSFDATPAHSPGNLTPASPIRPHRASDSAAADEAIRAATLRRLENGGGGLSFRDFRLLQQIGGGDIGKVYLCKLRCSDEAVYAMKVVDKEASALKKKSERAEMEKKILKMVDHPFLPSLYALFEDSHFSCIVMNFCSGGDLNILRHKLPHKRLSLSSASFYAAEVLVALEYLHMMGIIYRDLKPENVLVKSDGHIMLSDFDLSFYSQTTIPTVQSPDTSPSPTPPRARRPHRIPATFSCFPHRPSWSRKVQNLAGGDRIFVAEPVEARSCSFVGTHEYLAPEVACGGSHGSAVDWWALGIFIYEMIYGRTPFSGGSNAATLRNIVKKPLSFPTAVPASEREGHARSLISALLEKDPKERLGSKRGAVDVKTHPFFRGLNFALIRSVAPPPVPGPRARITSAVHGGRRLPTKAVDYF